MASLERTAYPQFLSYYSPSDLRQFFTLQDEEINWLKSAGRSAGTRLGLAVLLKVFQHLRYFPSLDKIPSEVITHVRNGLGFGDAIRIEYPVERTLFRHKAMVLGLLNVKPFHGHDAMRQAERFACDAAELMDQRADIINGIIEGVLQARYELPAFSTLDDLAEKAHAAVQNRVFGKVFHRITPQQLEALQALLVTDKLERRQSEYNELKKSAKRPTRKHLDMLVEHLEWLDSITAGDDVLAGLPDTKIRHFAAQAMAYDVSELRECAETKRYTLLVALIRRMQVRARDQLAEMFLRRVATIHKRAKEELDQIQFGQRGQIERLIGTLDGVLAILDGELLRADDTEIARAQLLGEVGEDTDFEVAPA